MRLAPLAALLALAGCAGSGPATIENTSFSPALSVNLAQSTRLSQGLYYRDVEVGTGATVAAGQLLSVHYGGWFPDGRLFDANGTGDTPFSFHLGAGDVIAGWDLGVAGMKVGGTRQLIIPPELAYGSYGWPGFIPPNAILVFTVQLLSAQ